jgi:RNA polymerase sigma factor (sigma-70 family)
MSSTLANLLRSAQAGDRAALNELLELLRPHLEALAKTFADPAHPSESASDLVQEVGMVAWKNLAGFRGAATDEDTERQLLAWLSQILRRAGIDNRRAARAQRRSPAQPLVSLDAPAGDSSEPRLQAAANDTTPSAQVRSQETSEQLATAVARLEDPINQSLVRIVFVEGQSLRQAAEQLQLTYDQVRHRYHKILAQLESELGDV